MLLLLFVSFIWAFSFGLIKGRLAGLDPVAIAAVRLAIAGLVFAPWILRTRSAGTLRWKLAAIGAVQFGIMYIAYLGAFAHLQAYEVALFTIFTPLYLTLIDALLERRWQGRHLLAAALAVVGAGVVLWRQSAGSAVVTGFLLVQVSNLCFAAGQLAYRRLRPSFPEGLTDQKAFGWLCLGGCLTTVLASVPFASWSEFHPTGDPMGGPHLPGRSRFRAGFLPVDPRLRSGQRRHPRRVQQRQGAARRRLLAPLLSRVRPCAATCDQSVAARARHLDRGTTGARRPARLTRVSRRLFPSHFPPFTSPPPCR
jgi:drug/metabolite transporter (DMT)-like permease